MKHCNEHTRSSPEETFKMTGKQTPVAQGTWQIRFVFQSLIAVLVMVVVFSALFTTTDKKLLVSEVHEEESENVVVEMVSNMTKEVEISPVEVNGTRDSVEPPTCDLFSGKWIHDNQSYPLYHERDCSFIDDGISCEKFGRKDHLYQNWRWQPHGCNLPRITWDSDKSYHGFNATTILERLRGKRLVFVGDSLNRNQWVSMVCLVQNNIPPELKTMNTNGSSLIFKALEYNATIEFYWSPLLVESNSDDLNNHRIVDRIVRANAIEKHARHWTDADVLVFNSYLWWRRLTLKVLWGEFGSSDGIYKDVESLRSYELALRTWSDWLDININRTKTTLFFTSMSPTHNRAEEWGKPLDQKCNNETEPISTQGHWGMDSDMRMMKLVETSFNELKTRGLQVQMLNITQLSEYRKDGHPSVYSMRYSKEENENPTRFADCIHWCLPGVPDTWNLLLYTYITGS